jgi:hypothetical protein
MLSFELNERNQDHILVFIFYHTNNTSIWIFHLLSHTPHPTATTEDDDICKVFQTKQGPHPKPAAHMTCFFTNNKQYDLDKLVYHATNCIPVSIVTTPGYLSDDGEH